MWRALDLSLTLCAAVLGLAIIARHLLLGQKDPYKCQSVLSQGAWKSSEPYDAARKLWHPADCMTHSYSAQAIESCLTNGTLEFRGDSIARQLFWATAQKIDATKAQQELLVARRHDDQDFNHKNVKLSFFWDPFLNFSSTSHGDSIPGDEKSRESIRVIGSGLWFARYLGEDWLLQYEDMLSKNLGLHSPEDKADHDMGASSLIVLPVILPQFSWLEECRRRTLTLERIKPMNEALLVRQQESHISVMWSILGMLHDHPEAYQSNGIHLRNHAANEAVQIILNYACNNSQDRTRRYPNDRTCCRAYPTLRRGQIACLIACILTLVICLCRYLWGSFTSGTPSRRSKMQLASAKIVATLLSCLLADRTHMLSKVEKDYDFRYFMALVSIVLIIGLVSIQRSAVTKKALNEKTLSGCTDQPFLCRDQSDELKGGMQAMILIYHYLGASRVLPIYKFIRLLVSTYLFLTGYGHTIHYLSKADFSFKRIATVLIRLDMLSILLAYIMNTDYLIYYFAPLTSFWFVLVTAVMAIRKEKNRSPLFVTVKIIVAAAAVRAATFSPVPFERLFKTFEQTANIHWNAQEWHFRLNLDIYIVFVGMLAGLAYHQFIGHSSPRSQHSNAVERHTKSSCKLVLLFSPLISLLLFAFSWIAWRSDTKEAYNAWLPIISPIPILSYLVLRNSTIDLRNFHSAAFAALGKCSLETFTLQFHIWLAADTKGILRSGLFGNGWGIYVDQIILTSLFIWLSWHVSLATNNVTAWLVNTDTHNQEKIEALPTRNDKDLMSDAHQTFRLPSLVNAFTSHLRYDLKFRLFGILASLWILNKVFTWEFRKSQV